MMMHEADDSEDDGAELEGGALSKKKAKTARARLRRSEGGPLRAFAHSN